MTETFIIPNTLEIWLLLSNLGTVQNTPQMGRAIAIPESEVPLVGLQGSREGVYRRPRG
jgi:hypothetical protein